MVLPGGLIFDPLGAANLDPPCRDLGQPLGTKIGTFAGLILDHLVGQVWGFCVPCFWTRSGSRNLTFRGTVFGHGPGTISEARCDPFLVSAVGHVSQRDFPTTGPAPRLPESSPDIGPKRVPKRSRTCLDGRTRNGPRSISSLPPGGGPKTAQGKYHFGPQRWSRIGSLAGAIFGPRDGTKMATQQPQFRVPGWSEIQATHFP